MGKPDCYQCKHRRELVRDTHSKCLHPSTGSREQNEFGDLVATIQALVPEGGDEPIAKAAKELGIKANAHGVKQGWFMWPANFDPMWLVACNGFEPKEEKTDAE